MSGCELPVIINSGSGNQEITVSVPVIFRSGEGIINRDVEETIRNAGRLGKEGMREADREIV